MNGDKLKMSEVLGLERKIYKSTVNSYEDRINKRVLIEHNKLIDKIDQREIDTNALAEIMVKNNINFLAANARYMTPEEMAQSIADNMKMWIVKRDSKGEK